MKSAKIGVVFILLVTLLAAVNFSGFSNKIKNFVYVISSPGQQWSWLFGKSASSFLGTILNVSRLEKENEQLRQENQKLLQENSVLKDFGRENKILREALDIGLIKEFKITAANILGKDISQDFLLINKGARDGVNVGNPVVNQQKVLYGKVSEIFDGFSKVMLISNEKSAFDAKIQDKKIEGVIKGRGHIELFLNLIPMNAELAEGDLVVTNLLGGIYPENLLVGKVKKIVKNDVEPFQKVEIEPFFNVKTEEILFIITDF